MREIKKTTDWARFFFEFKIFAAYLCKKQF